MRVLIVTEARDRHAVVVGTALAQRDHEVTYLRSDLFPMDLLCYLSMSDNSPGNASFVYADCKIPSGHFDVVWFRRPKKPQISGLQDRELEFAEAESRDFIAGFWRTLSESAFWVNPYETYLRATSKARQLASARFAGIRIPRTLMTNDLSAVRQLFDETGGNLVYKAFTIHPFREGQRNARICTTLLNRDHLDGPGDIKLAPGIFQECVPKQFELRVTAMGTKLIAAKIDSQRHPKGGIDWREIPYGEMRIEPFEMSDRLRAQLIAVMKDLGLVFGCFDLVATPDGEMVFLEVNQMGQFLWVELECPELHTLDCFVSFLENRTFDWADRYCDGGLRYVPFAEKNNLKDIVRESQS